LGDTPVKTARNVLIAILGIVVLFVAMEEALFWGPGRRMRKRLNQADHALILAACRQMIADVHTSHRPNLTIGKDDPSFSTRVSAPIRDLRPAYVLASTDHVMICLSALPRIYVLGFATNVEQYGTTRLIDGLWYSSSPADDERKAQPSTGANAG
jgi:hypothetical protein